MSPAGAPLGDRDAETLLAPLPDAVLLAVSGGPDSVALLGLAAGRGGRVVAATVDHGLRPESAGEARAVGALAAVLGVEHHVLPWEGPRPATGLQEAAREARYGLLLDLARRLGLEAVVTAHTLDDQAETVLMRMARGTGIAGLAAMRPATHRDGFLHLRPFLGVPKASLVATCRARGWPHAQDPSNGDERFARVRWRRLMPALAEEGLTAERLALLAERARRAEEALGTVAGALLEEARRGEGAFEAAALAGAPFEIGLRAFILACREAAGPGAPERLERLEAAFLDLSQALREGRVLTRTVAGTILRLGRSGVVTFAGEGERRRGR